MNESESKNKKPKEGRRFDPELLKKGLRCDLDQYDMLKRCSNKKDMTEWNEWRKEHKGEDILLEGKHFRGAYLQGVNLFHTKLKSVSFYEANLKGADLRLADLEDADLFGANLEDAKLAHANLKVRSISNSNLKGAEVWSADLENACLGGCDLKSANFSYAVLKGACFDDSELLGASFQQAIVDGSTSFWECYVDRHTDFRGVGLDRVRIDPGTKQLLGYNIRRKNWEDWYKKGRWWQRILKRLFIWPFWLISDYGLRTWRIIVTFFGLAIAFGVVYWLCPSCVIVMGEVGDIRGFWHALYFSVVTMTTLGFGDIAANPDSWAGQTLLMLQVILGYALLGALVTRFAVLFTAGGPAGRFANEQEKKDETE